MQSKHGQLTANTVTPVSIGGDPSDGWKTAELVEVFNRDGTAEIFFTVDGTTTPTTGGADNTYMVPATIGGLRIDVSVDGPVPLKLISSGTPKYTVTVLP